MQKKIFIISIFYLSLQASDVSGWMKDQNECMVFVKSVEKNTTLHWDGACKNTKANGEGILHWNNNQKNKLSDIGYFIGTLKDGKFDEGVLVLLREKDIHIGKFNLNPSHYFKGVFFKQEKKSMVVGSTNQDFKLEGEAFIARFSKNLYEHGIYENGERKNVLVSYFVPSEDNSQCTITTAIASKKKYMYQNYFDGLCSIRADINTTHVYANSNSAYILKNNSLYILKERDTIRIGDFKNNKLNGHGIMITPTFIYKGIFSKNIFNKGKTIEFP